jgi:uncharacterized protein (DUF433 family)
MTLQHLPIKKVVEDVTAEVIDLQSKRVSSASAVSSNRYVARNTLVVEGTRVPLDTIKVYLEEGFSQADILSEFPSLTVEDLRRAEEFLQRGAA